MDEQGDYQLGALAIEREIDRHLEALRAPIPSRRLLIHYASGCNDGAEITYTRRDGEKFITRFDATELASFRRNPRPETHAQIEQVAALLSMGQA